MGQFKLNKGYDIPLVGAAEKRVERASRALRVAVQPIDFRNLRPALKVKPGDRVKRGTVLFVDKRRPQIQFLSPAAGTVIDIVRGERRAIQRIIVETDETDSAESLARFSSGDLKSLDRTKVVEALCTSGLWPAIRKRPYTEIADPGKTPKAIFISAVDSAPLEAATPILLQERQADFKAGLEVLKRLTDGKVHLSTSPQTSAWFKDITEAEKHVFEGPHPAGNISVQAFHIDRVRSGEEIWYISPRHVAQFGRVLLTGEYSAEKIVAITGSGLNQRHYVQTVEGVQVQSLTTETIADDQNRVISGNVLTGRKTDREGYVGYYDDMITVIPEVAGKRFFSWVMPGFDAPSFWRTFFSRWLPRRERVMNTDLNGEPRAFVATGEYEKVMPMDILPMHLAKAILIEDIELMEQLGIYEVAPEDFALCSYICPSKTEFGDIIERGMIMMEKEG